MSVIIRIINPNLPKYRVRAKNNNYFKTRRARLMEKDPHCHWCGCEVFEYDDKNRKKPDQATIEHLFPRMSPMRALIGDAYGRAKTLVLACYKCNNERAKQELENTPVEIRRARAQGDKTAVAPPEVYPEIFGASQ